MKHFFTFYIFASVFQDHFFQIAGFRSAIASGDIIIGGLFPIHENGKVITSKNGTDTMMCDRFSMARLVQSLIMVQAVEDVNKRKELGNLTLGYHILDSCSDVSTALIKIQTFMRRDDTKIDSAMQPSPPVLAVVGSYHSELSIAVTRHLNLEHIPLISYGSTSGFLSDKIRFPSFMRTVPEDDHQARAIVQILKNHNWSWVGIVAPDGDYGRYAVERLEKHAKENNICFAFTSILEDVLGDQALKDSISNTVKTITENQNVSVIVSFAKPYHMMYIFDRLLKDTRGRGKVWLASDNWSESAEVLGNWTLRDVGTIFGTTLKSGNTTRMKQYLSNLDVNCSSHENNAFLCDFLKDPQQVQRGKPLNPHDTAIKRLTKKIYPYAVFSIELAIRAIAQTVRDLCTNRNCTTNQRLQPLEFRKALRNATFSMDGKNYTFDENGDLNSGYDLILWRQQRTFVDVHYVVAHYSIEKKELSFVSQKTSEDIESVTGHVISQCTPSCKPGYRRHVAVGQTPCCHECYVCPENHYSEDIDSEVCLPCNITTEYSRNESSKCILKKPVFLEWKDPFCLSLLVFTSLGAVLTLVVGIIFFARWNTPVVRASVGPICVILLLSLLCTFVSVILFGGEPNKSQCQTQQVLFGLSFTLCISCIMVKSFKIILAFEFDPSTQRVLKKLYKPYIIIAACMSGQIIICVPWLVLESPKTDFHATGKDETRLFYCNESSPYAFGAMLGYIGFLALICFGVAYKGRNLPQSYNDAKFITFAMLIYFICWIIFGPVYVLKGKVKYLPAVEMVVILISAYGILFCQFFTKCYIMLFKKEANTEHAFRQDIRNYSLGSIPEVGNGTWVLSSLTPGGIQNPAFDDQSPTSNSLSLHLPTAQRPSVSSELLIHSPVSNPQITRLQKDHGVTKKTLRRYMSLPESLP